jgi:Zn-dependent M16 (insulinase) family peptidase
VSPQSDFNEPNQFKLTVMFAGCARDDDFDHLLMGIRMMIFEPHCHNLKVLRTLISAHLCSLVQELTSDPGLQVRMKLVAGLNPEGVLSEEWSGLPMVKRLSAMVEADDWEGTANDIELVVKEIIQKGKIRIAVHVSSVAQQEKVMPKLIEFVRQFNADKEVASVVPPWLFEKMTQNASHRLLFIQGDTSANMCTWAVPFGWYTHPLAPVLVVFGNVLSHLYLHPIIRTQLGAYGTSSSYDGDLGIFSMTSFRDSNVSGVLAAFDFALRLAAEGEGLTDEVISNAVVECFGGLDAPVAPHARGLLGWRGKTKEMVQRRRMIYYNITKEQLIEAAKLLRELQPRIVVFSNETIAKAPEGFEVIPLLDRGDETIHSLSVGAD